MCTLKEIYPLLHTGRSWCSTSFCKSSMVMELDSSDFSYLLEHRSGQQNWLEQIK